MKNIIIIYICTNDLSVSKWKTLTLFVFTLINTSLQTHRITDLLYEMSQSLGYRFDKVLLKRGCYIPKGHGDTELEQLFIRRSLIDLFQKDSHLIRIHIDLYKEVFPLF